MRHNRLGFIFALMLLFALYLIYDDSEIEFSHMKQARKPHIVLVGDSLMRYQYFSLVELIRTRNSSVQFPIFTNAFINRHSGKRNFSRQFTELTEYLGLEVCECYVSNKTGSGHTNAVFEDDDFALSYYHYVGSSKSHVYQYPDKVTF